MVKKRKKSGSKVLLATNDHDLAVYKDGKLVIDNIEWDSLIQILTALGFDVTISEAFGVNLNPAPKTVNLLDREIDNSRA